MDWDHFFIPYIQTVSELKVKLRGLRQQYEKSGED
jgi:putative GTP pyrophosphokinase